jgi:hypothetical protein
MNARRFVIPDGGGVLYHGDPPVDYGIADGHAVAPYWPITLTIGTVGNDYFFGYPTVCERMIR